MLGIIFLAPAGYGQNVLIEKVLYSSPNSIDLLSANRTSGLVYFKTDDTFSLLYADVRNGKIVLDSTVSNLELLGYTKVDPVYSIVQLPDGSLYLLNSINNDLKVIGNTNNYTSLPKLRYDESNDLFYGIANNKIINCKISEDGISSVDTIFGIKDLSLSDVHSFNNVQYLSVVEGNNKFIAKRGEQRIQKLRYPINYGESSNDIVILNRDSLLVSRMVRLGEHQLALIYATEIVSTLDTVELVKVKEVETTQIDSVINENYIPLEEYTAQKQRDIGKGRWSTLIGRTTDALKAMVTLNEALAANPQSFSYKEDSVYFILGPKREVKAQAEKDSIFFSRKGIKTTTYDVVYDTLVKPADVILRLKCIDRLYGNMPGYEANFYEYESNTLVKSTTAFEDEVVYFSYLPEYTLGLTITSTGYLPHSLRVDPGQEYKTTDQIEKIIFLDRGQNPPIENLSEFNVTNASEDAGNVDNNTDALKSDVSRPVVLKNIFFGFDSDNLSAASKREIALVYNSQKNAKRLTIVGHTDSKGPAAYNQKLSEKRARQVEEYIYSLGFTGEIKSLGMGESQPIATNETEDGRSKNRRSEITITY
ncbi:MAG: Outer membrane porin F [Flavobacteriaceae bacterium]|nr:MAG: Outer membrane porin F [Flavobacteriaceae bacterium]